MGSLIPIGNKCRSPNDKNKVTRDKSNAVRYPAVLISLHLVMSQIALSHISFISVNNLAINMVNLEWKQMHQMH